MHRGWFFWDKQGSQREGGRPNKRREGERERWEKRQCNLYSACAETDREVVGRKERSLYAEGWMEKESGEERVPQEGARMMQRCVPAAGTRGCVHVCARDRERERKSARDSMLDIIWAL